MKTITEIYTEVGQTIIDTMVFHLENFRDPRHGHGSLDSSSHLIRSLDFDITFQERNVQTGQFQSIGLILFAEDYAEYLDRGRKAFARKVPISALIRFIKKRNLQAKIRGRGGRFLSVNSIAFMIQNSIYRHGINGRNFIQPALEAGEEALKIHIDRDLLDILLEPIFEFYRAA